MPDDLSPWLVIVSEHGPWLVLGGIVLRGIQQWTSHLCKLTPRVLDLLDRVQRDGIKIKVSIEDQDQEGEDEDPRK